MPQIEQGASLTTTGDPLRALVEDGSGIPEDATVLAITVETLASVPLAGFPTSVGIVHDGTGLYHYAWTCPIGQALGDYGVAWNGTISGGAFFGYETLTVIPAGSATLYCTLNDVKVRLAGDVPNMDTSFDQSLVAIIRDVCDGINSEVGGMRAVSGTGSANYSFLPTAPVVCRYTGYPGGTALLMIDDCVAVSSVTLLDTTGAVMSVLTLGTDYIPVPMSTFPITGLQAISSGICPRWPTWFGAVQVELTPGYGLTVPSDLHDVAVTETIRAYMSARAGENDAIGVGPLGTIIVSKAFTDKSRRILNRYSLRSGWFR